MEAVHEDRQDHNAACHHQLHIGIHTHQAQAFCRRAQDEDAQHGPDQAAFAATQPAASLHRCADVGNP